VDRRTKAISTDVSNTPKVSARVGWGRQGSARIPNLIEGRADKPRDANLDLR
jgi:hypothetical protein